MKRQSEEAGALKPVHLVAALAAAVVALVVLVLLFGGRPSQPEPVRQSASTTNLPSSTNVTHKPTVEPVPVWPQRATTNAEQRPLAELVRELKDTSQTLSQRKKAIEALVARAQSSDVGALQALKDALAGGASQEVRVAIVQELGECSTAECRDVLLGLLKDEDEAVARAAVRSLARQGSAEAAVALIGLLNDPQQSLALRCEAAEALGGVNQVGVVSALVGVARLSGPNGEEDIASAAVEALGRQDFKDTETFFRDYLLRSSDLASEHRVAAAEALASVPEGKGDPTGFLTEVLKSDQDKEVRKAAAWALSGTEAAGNVGPTLLGLLQTEQEAEVRKSIYDALRNQQSFDVAQALALIQREADPSARVAGMNLLAKTVRDNPTPQVQNFFDQKAVPELKKLILGNAPQDDRQTAVLALTRARTPAAQAALQEIAGQLAPPPAPPPAAAPAAATRPGTAARR